MRTIKFRGKRVDNGEWVYGDLHHRAGRELAIVIPEPDEHGIWYFASHLVKSDTVGQFTGLFDKNGSEIYEGDVLRSNEYPYSDGDVKDNYYDVVLWEESTAAFISETRVSAHAHVRGISHGNCDYLGALFENGSTDFEIIGNIHDNLELLRE